LALVLILEIINSADDKDIIFKCDDGSGGTTAYITLDGSQGFTTLQKAMRAEDNVNIQVGTSGDLRIFHDSTNSVFQNVTGNLFLDNYADDADIYFRSDNGAGGIATYFYLDGSSATHDGSATTMLTTNWPDKSHITLGTSHDFHMYHTGSQTVISQQGEGNLTIQNTVNDSNIIFACDDGSGGTTAYLTLDGSAGHITVQKEIQFEDNVFARFGTGSDMKIYHNGTTTFLENNNGDLQITNFGDNKDIIFQTDDGSGGTTTYFKLDGGDVKTNVFQTMEFQDNVKLAIGNSEDLVIDHNATNSRITNYTGDLSIVQNANDKDIIFQSDDNVHVYSW